MDVVGIVFVWQVKVVKISIQYVCVMKIMPSSYQDKLLPLLPVYGQAMLVEIYYVQTPQTLIILILNVMLSYLDV